MSKAHTEASDDGGDDDEVGAPSIPAGAKNYVTPAGYARLRAELMSIVNAGQRVRVE